MPRTGRRPAVSDAKRLSRYLLGPVQQKSVDYQGLMGLGTALALFEAEDDVARLLPGAVASALGVPFGAIVLHQEAGPGPYFFGHNSNVSLDAALIREIESYFVSPNAWEQGIHPGGIVEIEVNESKFPAAARSRLRRLIAIRLGTINRDFGAMIAGKETDAPYSPTERLALEALAYQASTGLYRVGMNRELTSRARALSFLSNLSADAGGSPDLARFMDSALSGMLAFAGMEAGVIQLVDEDARSLVVAAERNLPGIVKDMIENQNAFTVDMPPHGLFARCREEFARLREAGVESHLCIPITSENLVLGVMNMVSVEPRSFGQADLAAFNAAGEQLGSAVKNARLLDGRAKALERLTILNELMRVAVSCLETGEIVDHIADYIRQLIDFDLMILSLRPSGAEYAEFYSVIGDNPPAGVKRGLRLPLQGSSVGEVILTGRPVVRRNMPDDTPFSDEVSIARDGGYRASVLVRLQSKGRSIGALNFLSLQRARYGDREMQIAQEIADHLAVLVDDTLLHEELKELAALHERTRLAREMHDAVTQSFIDIILQLDLAERMMRTDVDGARREIDHARQVAQEGLDEARQVILALRPSNRRSLSLDEALSRAFNALTREGIVVNMSVSGTPTAIGSEGETAIIRVADEIVASIRKLTTVTRVEAISEYGRDDLVMTVNVHNAAFGTIPSGSGVGEDGDFNLAEESKRLQMLGGDIGAVTLPGVGIRITVRIPQVIARNQLPEPQPEVPVHHVPRSVIRVLVADDHVVFRQGIRRLLEEAPDIEVVAEAADGREALVKARATTPDVLVTDVRMPGVGAVELASALKADGLITRVIILSPYSQGEVIAQAMRAGAHGYLLKDLSGPELINAIRAVNAGETVMKPAVASELARRMGDGEQPEALTLREQDVLRLMARGLRNKEIARELGLSEATIKFHITHLFEKLGASGRTEAISKALQFGIIAPPQ